MQEWSAQTGAGDSINKIAETIRDKCRIPDKIGIIVKDNYGGLDYSSPISEEDRKSLDIEKKLEKQKSRFKSIKKRPYKPVRRRK